MPKACGLVIARFRQGTPVSLINKAAVVEPVAYTIAPLVLRQKATIMFGDGGKGKSTLGLCCGLQVSAGRGVAGFIVARPGVVRLLDWEDDFNSHVQRCHALQAAHPELAEAEVQYQRCAEPLAKMVHELARSLQRGGVTFLIIDSLLMAMGGESSAEAVGNFFVALRILNVDALCIGHVPKNIQDDRDATVYGSVFNQNLARSVWELRCEQEVGSHEAILALVHRKANHTGKHPSIGLRVTHNETGSWIGYAPYDLSQSAELETTLPLWARIRRLLESDGVPRTKKEIGLDLGEKEATVQATLSKFKGIKWSLIDGHPPRWTVLSAGQR